MMSHKEDNLDMLAEGFADLSESDFSFLQERMKVHRQRKKEEIQNADNLVPDSISFLGFELSKDDYNPSERFYAPGLIFHFLSENEDERVSITVCDKKVASCNIDMFADLEGQDYCSINFHLENPDLSKEEFELLTIEKLIEQLRLFVPRVGTMMKKVSE